jgi:hypothetical protein
MEDLTFLLAKLVAKQYCALMQVYTSEIDGYTEGSAVPFMLR